MSACLLTWSAPFLELFKKSAFDHEVNQEVFRHRILNSAGPSSNETGYRYLSPNGLTKILTKLGIVIEAN